MGANWSGSPAGPFNLYASAILAVGTTVLIAAPGAGLSLYLQTITVTNTGAVVSDNVFQDTGGATFADLAVGPGGELTTSVTFPGGLQIATNKGVQVVVGTNAARVSITYTIGPAL